MDRQVLALEVDSLNDRAHGANPLIVPRNARCATQHATAALPAALLAPSPHYQAVSQILNDILRSAAEMFGANHAFVLVDRQQRTLETAATISLNRARVSDLALRRAEPPIRTTLLQRRLSAANSLGEVLSNPQDFLEAATLCVPLDTGHDQPGVMCILRRRGARKLTELDIEIVHALAEQAAVAIGAASHQCALSRLEACLGEHAPDAH
jgi:GAF domain-containing protein